MNVLNCSVVIPAYNAAKYLTDAIQSVLNQKTLLSFEIIIVDDGSSDETLKVLSQFAGQLRVLAKENGGVASARNMGVECAFSDVVLFLDADDKMLPGRIEFQGRYMLEHPEVGLTYGMLDYELFPAQNDIYEFRSFLPNNEEFTVVEEAYCRLLEVGMFIRNAIGVRKGIYLEAGGQPNYLRVSEDYAMCINIAKIAKIACSNKKLNWYRQSHGGNLMSSGFTYYGPPRALADELLKIADDPNLFDIYNISRRRLERLCNMLIRNDWINADKQGILMHLEEFSPLVPGWLLLKWRLIWWFVPPIIGRWIRSVKREFAGKVLH